MQQLPHHRLIEETDPTGIFPGDTILLTVDGAERALPPGQYASTVVRSMKNSFHKELIVTMTQPGRRAEVFLQVMIYDDPRFVGRCFLSDDLYPVSFRHEQNLENRLRMSVDRVKRNTNSKGE